MTFDVKKLLAGSRKAAASVSDGLQELRMRRLRLLDERDELASRPVPKDEDLIAVHVPGDVMDEFGVMVAEEMRKIPSNVYPNDPENHAKISAMIEKSLARMEKQTEAAKARIAKGNIA